MSDHHLVLTKLRAVRNRILGGNVYCVESIRMPNAGGIINFIRVFPVFQTMLNSMTDPGFQFQYNSLFTQSTLVISVENIWDSVGCYELCQVGRIEIFSCLWTNVGVGAVEEYFLWGTCRIFSQHFYASRNGSPSTNHII